MKKVFGRPYIYAAVILIFAVVFIYQFFLTKPEETKKEMQYSPTPSDPGTTSLVTPIQPTDIPSPTPAVTLKPVAKPACTVVDAPHATDPFSIKLTYSLKTENDAQMTAAQWDFNGDGKWDTEWSGDSGNVVYKFTDSGTYNVRLHLQTSDGQTTDPCSKNVTVPNGLKITIQGKVYKDLNCNNNWEANESFLEGVKVNILKKPELGIYKSLTTDSKGGFSSTSYLTPGESLSVRISHTALPNYKIYYYAPDYILNSNKTSVNAMLSLVPSENFGICP